MWDCPEHCSHFPSLTPDLLNAKNHCVFISKHFWLIAIWRSLEKEMATHSSVLAWRIPGTGVPGGLPSMLSHRVGHDWSDLAEYKCEWEVAQSCRTLCDPMDYSLPGSSVHGIFQARVLEWVAISCSRGSSWPRDWIYVSCIAGRFFTLWAIREALFQLIGRIFSLIIISPRYIHVV